MEPSGTLEPAPPGEAAPEAPAAGAPPRRLGPLFALVFVGGAASLGTEIAAARLLAPDFGASTVIWANTIATVLVALSAGYALGGRLADRAPFMQRLCQIVAAAAVLLAAVPFLSGPLLRVASTSIGSLSVGAFFGSLLAVFFLVLGKAIALPSILPHLSGDSDVRALSFPLTALILIGMGLGLGAIGSGLTIRRFLQV